MPKFQRPTQTFSWLTPSQFSHLVLQLIHENMNIKLSEKMKILLVGSWPPISTFFKDTDSGLIEKSAVGPIKHVYFTFSIPILPLSRYLYDFWKILGKLGGSCLAGRSLSWILGPWHQEAHIPPTISKIRMFEHF